jgi:uncharacterized membrane protein
MTHGISLQRAALTLGLALGAALAMRRVRSELQSDSAVQSGRALVRRLRMTINRPPDDVYRAWGTVERLPRYFSALASVRADDGRSHWIAVTPGGRPFEWDMDAADARDGRLLVWKSAPGPLALSIGARFDAAPAERGTELTLTVECSPSTALAGFVARAVCEELREGLRRFKQLLEAGEIATVDGQPTGRAAESRRAQPRTPAARSAERKDEVEQASAASFPASDPPASRVVQ